MRKFCITICIILACLHIIPCLGLYQNYAYNKDKTEYDLAKAKYDSATVINRINVLDSLTNVWISANDTALRKIKKIKKTPEYGELGYYQKTGRLECEENYHGKLICEPEKQWITTDYYIRGYKKDTTWTEGYKTRDEWTKKASAFAKTEAIKIYQDFHEYNGYEYHHLTKKYTWMVDLYVFGAPICFLMLLFGPAVKWADSKGSVKYELIVVAALIVAGIIWICGCGFLS